MRGLEGGRRVRTARRVHARAVAQEGAAPGLVEGDPLLHAVAQRVAHDLRVLGEAVRRVALRPAARVLQLLREIPVVEGQRGLDAVREQLVDQAAVEVQAHLDRRAPAGRLHPRPGDREAVRGQTQVRHHRHVVAVAVVVVDSDVAVLTTGRAARRMTERVPDRGRTAALPHRPLDLVGGGRGAPEEGRGKAAVVRSGMEPLPWVEWRPLCMGALPWVKGSYLGRLPSAPHTRPPSTPLTRTPAPPAG